MTGRERHSAPRRAMSVAASGADLSPLLTERAVVRISGGGRRQPSGRLLPWTGNVRGLLLDGRRKSHFITSSPSDPAHARARLAWRMQDAIGPEALIVDDTGFLKDGDASACVSRQYTGTAGKVTKCQVGVSLHLANDRASAAVNWRLSLPASWDPASPEADADKTARRGRCGIPAQAGHVEKWQLALDMIDDARSWGVDVPLVVADAGHGDAAAFRLAWSSKSSGRPHGRCSGGKAPGRARAKVASAHVLAVRRPADPPRRTRHLQGRQRWSRPLEWCIDGHSVISF
nr:transposase [Streptomyces regalis]